MSVMRTASNQLPDDPEQLREIIHGLQSTVTEQSDLLAAKDSHIDE
jgi:hypothetical protein